MLGLVYEREVSRCIPAVMAGIVLYAILPYLQQHSFARAGMRCCWLGLLFFFGCMHMQSQIQFRETELAQIQEGEDISLCGEIYKKEFKQDQLLIYLKNCYAVSDKEQVACNRVLLYPDSDEYSIGDILIVNGKVNMFQTATNEGMFDARSYYRSQKIDFAIKDAGTRMAERKRLPIAERMWHLRRLAANVFESATDAITSGVLSVMILGEKSTLDTETKQLYQSMGISHILAISGLHVSLIGLGIYRFLRKRGFCYVSAFGMSGIFLFLYAVMTGSSVSTIRAVGMLFLLMLGDLWGRTYDALNALGALCLYLLCDNPFLLEYAGFVLSVSAVLGIATVGTAMQTGTLAKERETELRETGAKAADPVAQGGAIALINAAYAGVGIWLFTLPLIGYYFYEIPLYSALLNLFVVPLLKYLILLGAAGAIIGVCGGILCCDWGAVASVILLPCKWILNWYETAANFCAELPYARVIIGKPSVERIICYYAVLSLFFWLWGRYKKCHWIRIAGAVVVLSVLLIPSSKKFEVDVLDVGQGDGIYICSKEGISMFIDGGSSNVGQVGTYRILPFLKSKGVTHISYWFVSHTDEDHISGLCEVLKSGYPIEHLVVARAMASEDDVGGIPWAVAFEDDVGENSKNMKMQELIELAKACGTKIIYLKAGDEMQFTDTKITCLAPGGDTYSDDINEMCLVFLYQDNIFSGMFAGDISAETERALLKSYGGRINLDVDFYKADHHGSKYSNSREWIEALSPEISVISCSRNNTYGHPHEETLERLEAVGTSIYRTDRYGAVIVETEKDNMRAGGYLCP